VILTETEVNKVKGMVHT